MSKDYLTIPQAAQLCDVSRTTMWRWVKSGYIKTCMTLGGQHRIRKADLEEVLSANHIYQVPGAESVLEYSPPKPAVIRRGKILIVDDEPQVLKMMVKLLESHGYETAAAFDGFEAGIRVMEFEPDLMVLDLVMPGMDGFEVCKRIKENPGTSRIKVLAVTGFDTDENRVRIIKAGADGYLTKPLETGELIQEVEMLLWEKGGSLAAGAG